MTITTSPSTWSSSHRPIIYMINPVYSFSSAGSVDGNLELKISPPTDVAGFVVGSSVIVNLPSFYAGTYTITSITATGIVLNTAYVGNDSGTVDSTRIPCEVYAGYTAPHEGYADYPYGLVANITGIRRADGIMKIDVSGYLNSVLKEVKAPRIGRDFQMSIPYKLVVGGFDDNTKRYALNGTLEQSDLATYNADGKILNAREPIHFQNGRTIYSMIWQDTAEFGEHIVNIVATQGTGLA